jgi:hypothetical protein
MNGEQKSEEFKTPRQIDEEKVAEHRARVEEKQRKEAEKAQQVVQKAADNAEKEEEKKKAAEAKHLAAGAERMAKEQEKKEKIRAVREQEEKLWERIAGNVDADTYKFLSSGVYDEMDANLSLVCNKLSQGCIFLGKGGLGKTFRTTAYCYAKLGAARVAYIDSFTTPVAFFQAVYHAEQHGKEVAILDDVAGLMSDKKILNMLKSATAPTGDNKTRTMSYLTSKPIKDEEGEILPASFDVTMRFIILTNHLDTDNPHVRALITRINLIHVSVPRKELMKIYEQLIKKPYPVDSVVTLTYEERKECMEYCVEHTNEKTKDLNIRTLLRVMDYRAGAKLDKTGDAWKKLSLKLLQQDDRLALVETLILDDRFETEEERVDKFCEVTGQSPPTYYRLKTKVMKLLTERGVDLKALKVVKVAS